MRRTGDGKLWVIESDTGRLPKKDRDEALAKARDELAGLTKARDDAPAATLKSGRGSVAHNGTVIEQEQIRRGLQRLTAVR